MPVISRWEEIHILSSRQLHQVVIKVSGLFEVVRPASGITDDVWFWTPRGYSAADGKSYNVLMLLHGVPGTADGVVPGLELGRQLQAAIDDGRLTT